MTDAVVGLYRLNTLVGKELLLAHMTHNNVPRNNSIMCTLFNDVRNAYFTFWNIKK